MAVIAAMGFMLMTTTVALSSSLSDCRADFAQASAGSGIQPAFG
jgi:hypothetical protein